MPPVMDTPPPPPDVQGAMGGGDKMPFSGVGSMLAARTQQQPDKPGGNVDPQGAFKSAADAVGKVIDNMARMSKSGRGAAYAARMKQFLQVWMDEETKAGPATGGGGNEMSPLPSAKPAEGTTNQGFVG